MTDWNTNDNKGKTGVVDWGYTTAKRGDGGSSYDTIKEDDARYGRQIGVAFEEMDKICTCWCNVCCMLFFGFSPTQKADIRLVLGHHCADFVKEFGKAGAKVETMHEWYHEVTSDSDTGTCAAVFESWGAEMEEDSVDWDSGAVDNWEETEDTLAEHEHKILSKWYCPWRD